MTADVGSGTLLGTLLAFPGTTRCLCCAVEAKKLSAANDPLARSVDYEVSRLGFTEIDILKLSFSSLDLLRTRGVPVSCG